MKKLKEPVLAEGGKMKKIIIDGVEDASTQKTGELPVKIVVLQRGWVVIGYYERQGSDCKLHKASIIERWGTTEGLGQLAQHGTQENTRLRKTNGLVEFDILTQVFSIECNEEKWKNEL